MARQKRRIEVRVLRSGKILRGSEREATALVRGGVAEYVNDADNPRHAALKELAAMRERQAQAAPEPEPTPEPTGDELEFLTVAELWEQVGDLEVEGTGSSGNVVKADLIRALRGTYNRRDMQAEE